MRYRMSDREEKRLDKLCEGDENVALVVHGPHHLHLHADNVEIKWRSKRLGILEAAWKESLITFHSSQVSVVGRSIPGASNSARTVTVDTTPDPNVFLIYDPGSSKFVGAFDSKEAAINGVKRRLGSDIKITDIYEYPSGLDLFVEYETSCGHAGIMAVEKWTLNEFTLESWHRQNREVRLKRRRDA